MTGNRAKEPPAYNMGVPVSKTEIPMGLDWLRASVDTPKDALAIVDLLKVVELAGDQSEFTPLPYYNAVIGYNCMRIDWHRENERQRCLMTWTGKDLRRFEMLGGSIRALINVLANYPGCTPTRVDFAIDVLNRRARPEDVQSALESGKCETRIRSWNQVTGKVSGIDSGTTIYLGSRQSPRFIRVYDKAKQAGIDADWVRIEIEVKDRHAGGLLKAMERHGVNRAGCATIKSLITTGVAWFDDSLEPGAGVRIESVGRKVTDNEDWLIGVVLPNAIKAIKSGLPGFTEAIEAAITETKNAAGHS